jgi:ATP-dependent Clp protease adaptor protein ClpS
VVFSQKSLDRAIFAPPTGYNAAMAKQHQPESPVLEARRNQLSPPPLYTVLLLNDDFTPMDFVVHVLQRFFSMNREQATRIMRKVHLEGRGVCGVYPRDVAATKVERVSSFARENQHPLACIMEEN